MMQFVENPLNGEVFEVAFGDGAQSISLGWSWISGDLLRFALGFGSGEGSELGRECIVGLWGWVCEHFYCFYTIQNLVGPERKGWLRTNSYVRLLDAANALPRCDSFVSAPPV